MLDTIEEMLKSAVAEVFHRGLLLVLILNGFSSSLWAATEPGYLRTVGPPPLRFARPLPEPEMSMDFLKPQKDPELPVATAGNAAIYGPQLPAPAITNTNTSAAPLSEPVVATNPVTTNEPRVESIARAEPVQPPGSVQAVMPQPQLFLQYFTPDYLPMSNGYGLYFPVSFLPPQPSRGASSSAIYQITPSEKP